ncbi:hypothetical protein Desti_3442 [Desulfomonile tiedjei DSM 6799]|uniref:Lipoprotein n=1 Tax=Desulfomonile tiedjei (strain ATCC 49306 / DSM 6799 / DCB-1) TaxID=706587 RepID=I4C953_DESTA|nr:hypothetical protein Desti_3442 [Desulfomonile tiedjei DSM 6799]
MKGLLMILALLMAILVCGCDKKSSGGSARVEGYIDCKERCKDQAMGKSGTPFFGYFLEGQYNECIKKCQ